MNHNLPEVVGMPTPLEETDITESPRLLSSFALLEAVFLDIAHSLHDQSNNVEDDADDICRFPKTRLAVLKHLRRIQERDRQADNPYPEHLENPESKERKEFIPFIVEAVVFTRLQDPEEQEA